jgi:ATP-binding cassette, subfamily F, member 3
MSIIRLENITKRFGGVPVLEEVSFRVEEGEKIGLIGRNGTGKSTLFRIITGQIQPDEGVVERMRRARIACLAQFPEVNPEDTVFDIVLRSFQTLLDMEHELMALGERLANHEPGTLDAYSALQDRFQVAGGYDFRHRIDRVLTGLGFSPDEFGLPVRALSGGQRTRLMLALVLLEEADLLLLDEPENHLDMRAREWLENYITSSSHSFVIISHDRQILNAVARRTVEVERRRLRCFTGNYDAFVEQKALVYEQQAREFERQQKQIGREEAWIDRFRYKSSKARQVQSRVKRLEKVERIDAPLSEKASPKFHLGDVVRSGAVVLEARGLGMAYDSLVLYAGVDLRVERGERIGVIGANGSGKTTLLRHLAGTLDPSGGCISGTATPGHKVTLGFYDQHHESLNRGNDIFSEIRDARPDLTPEEVRSFMGRFLFTGEEVFKPVSALSGGELGRVAIAKLILGGANLLLLDEPTNHLDIATREILEEALEQFLGTLVLVSHDRELIDRLCNRILIVHDGQVDIHLGNYSDYRNAASGVLQSMDASTEAMKIRARKEEERERRNDGKLQERERRKQQRLLEELESDIASMESVLADFENVFTTIDPGDYEKLRKATEEYEDTRKDLGELYREWEAVSEKLDAG